MLDAYPTVSAATSESGSSGSSELGSLSTEVISYTPSESYTKSDLPREVSNIIYNRLVLNNTAL